MKTMNIDGVDFEVQKDSNAYMSPWRGFLLIHDAYSRPSAIKEAIYDEWWDFFYCSSTMKIVDFGVISYNCNFFTLGACVEIDGQDYNITITRAHKRISKVVR